jgi:hypothetical protein
MFVGFNVSHFNESDATNYTRSHAILSPGVEVIRTIRTKLCLLSYPPPIGSEVAK